MRKGLTLANRAWDRYTDAEMAALVDLSPDTIVWLLYDDLIDQTHAQQLRPFIDAHHPVILYRPYRDDIPTLDPVTWATQCDHMITAVGYPGELIPANEMNLAVEHGSEAWAAHITWLKAFSRQWRKIQPNTPLHLPALSPIGNYHSGWAAYHNAGLLDFFDVADLHIYGTNEDDDSVFPILTSYDGPISITEFNGIDPKYMADFECRDCVWFLLGGTPDQAAYDILTQPSYYASFKAMHNTPSTPPKPPPQPGGNTVATYSVGQGVKDLMKAKGDTPKSDEQYVGTSMSFTFGDKGVYIYSKQANQTYFLAKG